MCLLEPECRQWRCVGSGSSVRSGRVLLKVQCLREYSLGTCEHLTDLCRAHCWQSGFPRETRGRPCSCSGRYEKRTCRLRWQSRGVALRLPGLPRTGSGRVGTLPARTLGEARPRVEGAARLSLVAGSTSRCAQCAQSAALGAAGEQGASSPHQLRWTCGAETVLLLSLVRGVFP